MIEQILTMLAETPRRIATLTTDLSPAQLHISPNHGEWSANDVLAHLRSCSDVWGNCIKVIISQDKPIIRAVNPRTWINRTDYLEQKFQPSLYAFATQRADLLAVLETLPRKSWSRKATGAGKPLVLTVHSYAQRLARHERPHIKQIESIVNTLYIK